MKIFYVAIIILTLFSCNKGQQVQKSNKTKLLIPELLIIDSVYFSQLENVIYTSNCFSLHQKYRKVFCIFESNIFEEQNVFGVSFNSYCGYTESDLKDYFGGFFVKRNELLYLFLVENKESIMHGIFRKSKNMVDVTPYLGIVEESDAIWYFKYKNKDMEMFYFDCP